MLCAFCQMFIYIKSKNDTNKCNLELFTNRDEFQNDLILSIKYMVYESSYLIYAR